MDIQPALLPIDAAAYRLGIGRTKIYQLIDSGELSRVKIGAKALITADSIDRFTAKLMEAA